MKKGEILKGCFAKIASKTWWECEFIGFDENGNYIVNTDKGIKTFKKDQYYPDAIKSR